MGKDEREQAASETEPVAGPQLLFDLQRLAVALRGELADAEGVIARLTDTITRLTNERNQALGEIRRLTQDAFIRRAE